MTQDLTSNGINGLKEPSIRFLTFNTWGLKWASKHRKQRLRAIADELAGVTCSVPLAGSDFLYSGSSGEEPASGYDVVALQEIWCKEDWDYIAAKCSEVFPYQRIFYSGIIAGPGLAILSRIPIQSTFLYRFPINGRPSAVHRGDWYVGKSVAITLLEPVDYKTHPVAIMNSHMHAPYALTGDAAYACHRSCQAWDFSKLANLYKKAGYAVIISGDLNSRPGSLPHKFLTMETGLVDSWEQLNGKQDLQLIARQRPLEQLKYGCTTCDSLLNTWRASRKPDEACRLDYALIDPERLQTLDAGVRFTGRIPNVGSFSDHFAYACTLKLLPKRDPATANSKSDDRGSRELLLRKFANYEEMIRCIASYRVVARRQKFFRCLHFYFSILLLIAALVVTTFTANKAGWSSIFWVLFAVVVSVTGTIDGFISFLFGRKELRALKEVEEEVLCAQRYLKAHLKEKTK